MRIKIIDISVQGKLIGNIQNYEALEEVYCIKIIWQKQEKNGDNWSSTSIVHNHHTYNQYNLVLRRFATTSTAWAPVQPPSINTTPLFPEISSRSGPSRFVPSRSGLSLSLLLLLLCLYVFFFKYIIYFRICNIGVWQEATLRKEINKKLTTTCTVDSHCLEFGWLEFPVESNFYQSPELRCV
jgi:hypothetical protein